MPGADRPDKLADHPDTLRARNKLAMSYLAAGKPAKAIPLYRQTLADCERVLGPNHSSTLRARNNLAMSYLAAKRPAEAIPLLKRTLADCQRVLRPDHPDTLTIRHSLACWEERATG